jgi:hypothetical protein
MEQTHSLGRFTLWPKAERLSIPTNQIARNQEFSLSTLHTRGQSPKVVALQNAYMGNTFLPRRRTLEGSLGWIGMETQNMIEKPSIFFIKKKNQKLTRPWQLDWRGRLNKE